MQAGLIDVISQTSQTSEQESSSENPLAIECAVMYVSTENTFFSILLSFLSLFSTLPPSVMVCCGSDFEEREITSETETKKTPAR